MKVEQIKINSLVPHPKNVRVHGTEQMVELQKSIRMFGQFRPIVVDENDVILVGHGIWGAMKNEGKDTCSVYRVTGMSEAKKLKLMLADNKTYELGSLDFNALESVICDIASGNEGLDIPGYDSDTIALLVEDQNEGMELVDEKIQDYGKLDEERVEEIKTVAEKVVADPLTPPPVREVELNPAVVQVDAPATPNERPRPFAVCPKCGEKVWL